MDAKKNRIERNIKSNRLLNKTKLEYSREIMMALENNPDILEQLLSDLEVTNQDFFDYISGVKQNNIVFYDQALDYIKKRVKVNNESK